MSKLSTAIKLFHSDRKKFMISFLQKIGVVFSDKMYLLLLFRLKMGRRLNLKKPQTFNEKLQWLKLFDHNPLYTELVDKSSIKDYVAKIIGKEHIIPTLGIWNKANEIDFNSLPNQFVLKTTNGGGGDVIICKDKSTFDCEHAIRHLNQSLKKNIYRKWREWPYKNIRPRIIAEQFISDGKDTLSDFKVMCFNGVPKLIQLHEGRFHNHTQDFYDSDWNHLPICQGLPLAGKVTEKPLFLNEMLKLCRQLSYGIPHVRVDWYYAHNKLFFGEMTFFDGSGFYKFDPPEYDKLLGTWITLPEISLKV